MYAQTDRQPKNIKPPAATTGDAKMFHALTVFELEPQN